MMKREEEGDVEPRGKEESEREEQEELLCRSVPAHPLYAVVHVFRFAFPFTQLQSRPTLTYATLPYHHFALLPNLLYEP